MPHGCVINRSIDYLLLTLPNLNIRSPFSISIRIRPNAKNGLHNITGISLSSSMLKTKKSVDNICFPALMSTNSTMSCRCVIIKSKSYNDMVVALTHPIPISCEQNMLLDLS